MVTRLAAILAAALILTGCAPVNLDPIMGRTDGTPTTVPQRLLDCDLIFPAPSSDTLKP
jgi:PBP1b-binding outer membrane lipoprotein LpoB